MPDRSVSSVGDINRSVVVTGDGNVVRLSFGASGLVLPVERKQFAGAGRRQQPAWGEQPRELDVLDPARGMLPLIGRERELDDLRGWLNADVDISVHGLIGPAGTGKTRLAIGLCAAIDGGPRSAEGWLAGFMSPESLPSVADAHATADFDWEQPTLLVIDYAAQGYEALGRWLDQLAAAPPLKLGIKLRILLLDRQAPEGFGWWHELYASPLNSQSTRKDLFRRPRLDDLGGLEDLEIRRRVIAEALSATATLHGSAIREVPRLGADVTFDARLSEPVFGNALSLVMAGVIGHEMGLDAALALRRLDAARHLGARQLSRLEKLAGADAQARAMRHLVAFNGMTGGLAVAGLGQALQTELAAIGAVADTQTLAALLQQELPPPATRATGDVAARLGTIQPDLIGEAMIVEAFEAPPSRQAEGIPALRRAYALAGVEAAQALMRLLQDYAYALEDPTATGPERETAARLLGWLKILVGEMEDPEALEPLAFALPAQTLVLREIAEEVTGYLADAYGRVVDAQEDIPVQAMHRAMVWTANHSCRLYDLGDLDAALVVAERAERLAQVLFAADAQTFRDDLASSLNNLANRLSDLGRREEALVAAQEAVALYRTLAASRPDAFTPDIAMSLNNLANHLSDLGRREEALVAAQEAVALYRTLAAARPDAFSVNLSTSLGMFANLMIAMDDKPKALETVYEAIVVLAPTFMAMPPAVAQWMGMHLQRYLKLCKELGRDPDVELLMPIIDVFQKLQNGEQDDDNG